MEILAETFWIQKAGCSEEEYEDAASTTSEAPAPLHGFRAAIADGATDSSFSGRWAQLLTRKFVEVDRSVDDLESLLPEIQDLWASEVDQRALPWYAAEKATMGAFSSLLGVAFQATEDGREGWRAVAVGDSCLVQVRRNELVVARFPISESSHFTASPFLIASRPGRNVSIGDHVRLTEGDVQPEDTFYLMTDALACWFISDEEDGRTPWSILKDLHTADGEIFPALVARLRAESALKNDDCTLVRIDVH
ncbi:MAG: protein phosphatase 2C domain-containing protein [Deltaproteobacteria bacterium]|nr:protein phosphatase 2C domain-containing protein [Kofleriaceae bacterium]